MPRQVTPFKEANHLFVLCDLFRTKDQAKNHIAGGYGLAFSKPVYRVDVWAVFFWHLQDL